jgi:purine-cytosine permease-like protein
MDMNTQEMESLVGRKSAWIYSAITLFVAGSFFAVSTIIGSYSITARLGGTIWTGLLTMIVSMPLVTASVKKHEKRTN